ncbi:hypothetical protein [Saprospira grandis]|nr:hypothetical protein [Saprospira grandis]
MPIKINLPYMLRVSIAVFGGISFLLACSSKEEKKFRSKGDPACDFCMSKVYEAIDEPCRNHLDSQVYRITYIPAKDSGLGALVHLIRLVELDTRDEVKLIEKKIEFRYWPECYDEFRYYEVVKNVLKKKNIASLYRPLIGQLKQDPKTITLGEACFILEGFGAEDVFVGAEQNPNKFNELLRLRDTLSWSILNTF